MALAYLRLYFCTFQERAKYDLELLTFLLPPPERWDHRHELPSLVYVVLGMECRAPSMLDENSTSQAMSLAFL